MVSGVEKTALVDRSRRFLRFAPWWFWLALMLGAFIRLYFVVFTEGTADADIWQKHAAEVARLGLTGYYRSTAEANHPPFILLIESLLLNVADDTGVPFRILLRLPFAVLDAGTAALLICLLRPKPWRFVAGACYWLHPLAMIFSAYHGNTDSAVAFFLLLCIWLLSKGNFIGAGIALGFGFWIKLPAAPAIPALLLLVPGWRKKLVFLCTAGIIALSTYLPALFQDPQIIFARVFGYHGLILQTKGGAPFWGIGRLALPLLSGEWQEKLGPPLNFFILHGWQIGILLMLFLPWLRRSRRTAGEVCATIAAGYVLLFGFTASWSFQYFAWTLPFWFFCDKWFALTASFFATGYIYSLYWLLCGNPWLLGKWDFLRYPHWSPVVLTFRNLSVLFFFCSGCWFLASAAMDQLRPGAVSPQPEKAGHEQLRD